jgi:Tfp pilus assembly pilus retraction ATPase PilT
VERGAGDVHLHNGDAVRLRIGGCIAEEGTAPPSATSLEKLALAGLETLVVTTAVANLIRENKTLQIHSILQTGAAQGMGLLDRSIRQHVQSGAVAAAEARHFCQDPKSLGARGFGPALSSAIREDADAILVGEMRGRETIALAITAAEMGLLVFGTIHTNGAAKTIDRIIDAFPGEEQNRVRISLSESLTGVVSQLLLPTADGKGRCVVHEIPLRTQGLPNVIREGNTPMLHSIIQSSRGDGTQAMDDAITAALKAGLILPMDVYAKAADKNRFEPLLQDAEKPAA